MLHLGPAGRENTFESALGGASRMGLRPRAAEEILQRVLDVTGQRLDYYERAGLTANEVAIVERCLSAWHALEGQNSRGDDAEEDDDMQSRLNESP